MIINMTFHACAVPKRIYNIIKGSFKVAYLKVWPLDVTVPQWHCHFQTSKNPYSRWQMPICCRHASRALTSQSPVLHTTGTEAA